MGNDQRVVIVGGGFGGLNVAKSLGRAPLKVTLIDRRNFHLFQPLLYQVATGSLSPANIAAPLRAILKRHRNTEVLLAEVKHIDVTRRVVVLDEEDLPYDVLVVASGSSHHYFGHPEWEPLAPSLKTIEDATEIRRRVLSAFEAAEREPDAARRGEWLTFVVVGGGPTGVELAGAVAELARHTLKGSFRHIQPEAAKIVLVEGTDHVLPSYVAKLSDEATRSLEAIGVSLRTEQHGHRRAAKFRHGAPRRERRNDRHPHGAVGGRRGGVAAREEFGRSDGREARPRGATDRRARSDARRTSRDFRDRRPGVLPRRSRQAVARGGAGGDAAGRYVARALTMRRAGQTPPPFRYHDRGTLATIGRARAVADIRGFQVSGLLAWLIWLTVHLMYLVEFQNRILVLVQWAWSYTTRNSPARLITGKDGPPRGRGTRE